MNQDNELERDPEAAKKHMDTIFKFCSEDSDDFEKVLRKTIMVTSRAYTVATSALELLSLVGNHKQCAKKNPAEESAVEGDPGVALRPEERQEGQGGIGERRHHWQHAEEEEGLQCRAAGTGETPRLRVEQVGCTSALGHKSGTGGGWDPARD